MDSLLTECWKSNYIEQQSTEKKTLCPLEGRCLFEMHSRFCRQEEENEQDMKKIE